VADAKVSGQDVASRHTKLGGTLTTATGASAHSESRIEIKSAASDERNDLARRSAMLFTEPIFLFLFLPILLALYFVTLTRDHAIYGNCLLLVASVVFYSWGGGAFTWLMLGSIAFNYGMAIGVDRTRGTAACRTLLACAVGTNLVVLGVFKYANFFVDNVDVLFRALGVHPVMVSRVLLPIGISFYTFHAISYVVDIYRRDATAQKSPIHAALYLLLFPQLIAGPIIRYRDIAGQLARRAVGLDDFAYGVRRFIIGLAKKILIANLVAGTADAVFGMPSIQLTAGHAWLGIVCYTLQIYFDFSGYSDMAIGLGRMFGFRFPENFRYPYVASTVQDFWRRWHISLSSWFRDYLYVSLGGNRVSSARMYGNLVTVFLLCGLWHGASWNFVIWGGFHGLFLVIERVGLADRVRRLWAPLQHVYLLLIVMVGWVFFRADTLPAAAAFLRAMAGLSRAVPTQYAVAWYITPELCVALIAGAIGSMPVVPALARWREHVLAYQRPMALAWMVSAANTMALVLLLIASIMQVAAQTYNPFIYFRF
jgi:alginate O-acetyltransferase complex protein AlgI